MRKIEIDDEVFDFLQKKASPFVDTPNSVLRRLLLDDKRKRDEVISTPEISVSTDEFVVSVLRQEYKELFRKVQGYRWMFESMHKLIYFQNFNKPTERLWFRITEKPLSIMKASDKEAIICLTNPSAQLAYWIPLKDIIERVKSAGWDRPHLEINIDVVQSRWIDLDWNLESYKKQYA